MAFSEVREETHHHTEEQSEAYADLLPNRKARRKHTSASPTQIRQLGRIEQALKTGAVKRNPLETAQEFSRRVFMTANAVDHGKRKAVRKSAKRARKGNR
jgi:hypothetical protein